MQNIRRAKIVCTLGPATYSAEAIRSLVDAGMDVIKQKHDALVSGVKSGDVLLYRTWFNDEYDAEVKSIYHDAGK